MNEWSENKLGEICEIKGGKRLPMGEEFSSSETQVPYLRVTDMVNGTIEDKNLVYISRSTEEKIKNYKISKNDLYVTIAGTLGLFGSIPEHLDNAQLTENAAKLTNIDFSKIDKVYLKYYLNSDIVKNQIFREIGIGGGVPKLALHRIEKIKIKYPEIRFQKKISSIIYEIDKIILETGLDIDKLKSIKQGMMQDLFTRGLDEKGKLRPRYEDVPELYRKTEFGWIPKEWKVGKLIDFASDKSHSFTGGPFGSDLQTKHYTQSGVRIIQLQNIGDGIFYDDYKIFTSKEKADQLFTCNIFPGEIIIAKMADPVARACIVPDKDGRYLMASDGIRLSIDKKEFNTRFVLETINSKEFRRIAIAKSTGSTRARIGLTELREIPVKYPSIEEQNMISLKIDAIDNQIAIEEKYLSKSIQLKSGLMQDLLSGKKRVNIRTTQLVENLESH